MNEKGKYLVAIVIAVFAFLFQISLQSVMRPNAKDNLYFQAWSSETMMQTVSIEDLINAPLETLYNIHIQPPALDLIRATLVHIWPAPDSLASLLQVDLLLYQLWALLYSFLGAIFFLWMFELTGMKVAVISSVIFLLHPANLFYATLLEGTLLTSLLVFILCYLLWKIKHGYEVSIAIVAIVILTLFFTRSIFQFPFVIVVGISLFLLGMPKRKVLLLLLVTGSVAGLYTTKQYYQFGTLSTSSFTGLNLNRSVGNESITNYWEYLDLNSNIEGQENELPITLTRTRKINGATNFNHINYIQLNQHLVEQYIEYVRVTPVSQLFMSYLQNLRIYFRPSSRYTEHVIVDSIPWRHFYDRIFSFPVLNILILLFGILWLVKIVKRRDHIASTGLVLPALYIFLLTVFFEKGENMRFKYFLEPVLVVFLFYQLYYTSQQIYERLLTSRST